MVPPPPGFKYLGYPKLWELWTRYIDKRSSKKDSSTWKEVETYLRDAPSLEV
jgi:hypothetical protein